MALSRIATLFGTMVVLAVMPSPSVFAVVARSIASGFTQGLVTVLGVVAGDIVFILLAVGGLSAMAETMGGLFTLVKGVGSIYLMWLGIGLWRAQPKAVAIEADLEVAWASNFLCGLLITLSDPKAILFYVSFLPAFLDVSTASMADIGILLTSATVAVGGGKLVYVYLADQSRQLFQRHRARKVLNLTAGSVMVGTGLMLLFNR